MTKEQVDRRFEHLVTDATECCDFQAAFQIHEPPAASIEMSIGDDGFWLQGTAEGFLHLARVFAEMGLRDHESGYHFHVDKHFRWSQGAPEFSFMVVDQKDVGQSGAAS